MTAAVAAAADSLLFFMYDTTVAPTCVCVRACNHRFLLTVVFLNGGSLYNDSETELQKPFVETFLLNE